MSKRWMNEAGWSVELVLRDGRGARLALSFRGEPRMTHYFDFWEVSRAVAEAESLAEAIGMEPVKVVTL